MKKLIALLLALAMVFCFAACGDKSDESAKDGESGKSGESGKEEAGKLDPVAQELKTVVENYLDLHYGWNVEMLDKAAVDQVWDTLEDWGYPGQDEIEENWDAIKAEIKDITFSGDYEGNTVKLVSYEEVDVSEVIEDFAQWDIEEDDITTAYIAVVDYTIHGSEEDGIAEGSEITIVEIDGELYTDRSFDSVFSRAGTLKMLQG